MQQRRCTCTSTRCSRFLPLASQTDGPANPCLPQMATPSIYGLPAAPAAVADARGNCLTVHSAASPAWLERLLRPVCAEMGASAGFSSCPLTG